MAISCGRSHTVSASASGQVFCWGDNTRSQCGVVGPETIDQPLHVPIVVHSDGTTKSSLSESCESTKELPEDRELVRENVTGSDDHGSLCTYADCCHAVACHRCQTGCSGRLVSAKIVQVSSGWTHTAVLSNSGKLWGWGTGVQVGIADCASVPVPYPVEFPADRQVISVSCGGQHTIALTVRREGIQSSTAVVHETSNTGVSRTVSYTPGMVQNIGQPIKLSSVPPEAKKGLTRRSTSNQPGGAANINSESSEPAFAADVDIPMHNLASLTAGECRKDNGYVASELLASTCIDVVCNEDTKSNNDLPADVRSESSYNADNEVASQSCTDASLQTVPISTSGSVPKSRSSFLDETEAKIFLEKQLCDASSGIMGAESRSSKDRNLAKADRNDAVASVSPFAKTVESLLQHVPSSPVVQEYVSNLTRSVVSNLRTSVDRRLNYVTSQVELSLSAIASLSKVTEAGDAEVNIALDDSALLERLALSNHVSIGRSLLPLYL